MVMETREKPSEVAHQEEVSENKRGYVANEDSIMRYVHISLTIDAKERAPPLALGRRDFSLRHYGIGYRQYCR